MAALLFVSRVHDPAPWLAAMRRLAPDLDIRVWPEVGAGEDIAFALVWSPPPGLLAGLPRLRAVSSFGAGVEHILRDPTLPPDLPVVRVVEDRLTGGMCEYVLLHVLRHHRELDDIVANQRAGRWQWLPPANTPTTTVGVMGLGVLGGAAASQLAALGFRVVGWSRSPKELPGVECFVGDEQRDEFLAIAQILVCLLPATAATQGIINRATLSRLPRGAYVINAGRGEHVVDADLLAAIDGGHIAGATLDVFNAEPLPPGHPYWRHPRILVTPHNAADSLPEAVAPQIVDNFRRAMRGEELRHQVDRLKGY